MSPVRVCATLVAIQTILAALLPGQGIGSVRVGASVVSSEPMRAGLARGADIIRQWNPGSDSLRRTETDLAIIMLTGHSGTAVLSIQFLRN